MGLCRAGDVDRSHKHPVINLGTLTFFASLYLALNLARNQLLKMEFQNILSHEKMVRVNVVLLQEMSQCYYLCSLEMKAKRRSESKAGCFAILCSPGSNHFVNPNLKMERNTRVKRKNSGRGKRKPKESGCFSSLLRPPASLGIWLQCHGSLPINKLNLT